MTIVKITMPTKDGKLVEWEDCVIAYREKEKIRWGRKAMRFHLPTEPMKQRFKKGKFWRFSPDDIHFRDDPDDIGRDIRTLGYKPHSHPWGRKPMWRAGRKTQQRRGEF